jgi:Potential Queuosine, Q, salvage protein family
MDRILNSVKQVIGNSKHVSISQHALEAFADTIKSEELADVPPFFEKDDSLSLEQSIAFGFVYNAVNFSYWGEPKWTVNVDGKDYDGGIGMLRAIQRGIKSGYDLLSAEYLRTIPEEDLQQILKGNIEIPLFTERLALLRTLGKHISNHYNGSFTAFVDNAEWDAVKLVERLADEIPEVFNDEEAYEGLLVKFYKRAQLLPSHLHELKQLNISSRDVTSMSELTALADYKIPQLLRKYNVLQYTPDLARRIDSLTEIAVGSEEEVEIRAMTVWAVELLVRYLKSNTFSATAIQIDHVLWLRSQQKSPDDKPYHRTRTTGY